MKTMKSKKLFILSVIVVAIFFIGCVGAMIHLLTQRTNPAQVAVNNSPTPSFTSNAITKQTPGELIQASIHDDNEPIQNHPDEGSQSTDLPQTSPEPLPTVNPEQGTSGLEQGEENPNQQAAEPTPGVLPSLQLVSREEAGLYTIPRLNFDSFVLNQRIHELLLEGVTYTNEDMKNGIEPPYLVTERFQESIIENITIGTSIEEVIRVLGAPSFQERNMTVYKTNSYYIGFFGAETVELANFLPVPEPCDADILNTILTAMCIEAVPLNVWIGSDDPTGFFDDYGAILGGDFYAYSSHGVKAVLEESGEVIEIFNNYEGSLYRVQPDDTGVDTVFTNTDRNLDSLYWGFISRTSNDAFIRNGKVSPSGKYIAKYDWITSMDHYFTIRTVDYSAPDYQIGAVADQFEWLNDDYIVYTGTFSTLPAVLRVTDDAQSRESIHLMEGFGEEDYFYGAGDYNFSIDAITTDTIRFKDNKKAETDEGTYWEVRYFIDETGRFQLVK